MPTPNLDINNNCHLESYTKLQPNSICVSNNDSSFEIDDTPITKKKIYEWNVENVAYYLSAIDEDKCFSEYIDVFKEQKIDGKSLLLINIEILIKYMNMKIGPALQLNSHIEKLKSSYFTRKNNNIVENVNDLGVTPKTLRLINELVDTSNDQKIKVTEWSTEKVANYIETLGKRAFTQYANKFRDQMINGEALLSLNVKNLVEQFQMKLGPAIELNDHLEQLRCSMLKNLFTH